MEELTAIRIYKFLMFFYYSLLKLLLYDRLIIFSIFLSKTLLTYYFGASLDNPLIAVRMDLELLLEI